MIYGTTFEPNGRIWADFSMSEEVAHQREAGFVVYVGVRKHVIEGGIEASSSWPVAYIVMPR